MTMLLRLCALAVLLGSLTPVLVRADAQEGLGGVYNSFESGSPSHDAGVVRGEITHVDYEMGTIQVRTSHGSVSIAVLPSTSIYAHGQYATLADLRRGATVEITVSEVDGRLVAQTIHLK